MKKFAVSVLAIAAGVAFIAPHATRPSGTAARALEEKSQQADREDPAWGGVMVLDRAGDGHFYVDARINDSDHRMLIDTGATVVALTGEDASDSGLDWNPDALSPVAQGASGPVMGVSVTIPQMSVGDFEAHDVQAIIVPQGLPISLLGQSFLSHVPKVEIAGDTLTLSD